MPLSIACANCATVKDLSVLVQAGVRQMYHPSQSSAATSIANIRLSTMSKASAIEGLRVARPSLE